MGCGKSSIGRPLAKRLGLKFVDMDTEIERRCGVSVQQFFADRGEGVPPFGTRIAPGTHFS